MGRDPREAPDSSVAVGAAGTHAPSIAVRLHAPPLPALRRLDARVQALTNPHRHVSELLSGPADVVRDEDVDIIGRSSDVYRLGYCSNSQRRIGSAREVS
jgi:hypothetical protein